MRLLLVLHTEMENAASGDGKKWKGSNLDMLESSEYQSPTTRHAEPILIEL
jgi:hypothetical protein